MDLHSLAGYDSRTILSICGGRRQINARRKLRRLQRQVILVESLDQFGFPGHGWMTRAAEYLHVHRGTVSRDWSIVLREDAKRRKNAALDAEWNLIELKERMRIERLAK